MNDSLPISLRPIQLPNDLEFLHRVYASTREAELSLTDWDETQKEAFTRMQFAAQHDYYQSNYSKASFMIVEVNDIPAGRLYLDRRSEEIRIVDISLLPTSRGCGIGTQLLNEVLDEARSKNLDVTIHVESFNPARRLYERLGFKSVEDKGVYIFMRCAIRKNHQDEHIRKPDC